MNKQNSQTNTHLRAQEARSEWRTEYLVNQKSNFVTILPSILRFFLGTMFLSNVSAKRHFAMTTHSAVCIIFLTPTVTMHHFFPQKGITFKLPVEQVLRCFLGRWLRDTNIRVADVELNVWFIIYSVVGAFLEASGALAC